MDGKDLIGFETETRIEWFQRTHSQTGGNLKEDEREAHNGRLVNTFLEYKILVEFDDEVCKFFNFMNGVPR